MKGRGNATMSWLPQGGSSEIEVEIAFEAGFEPSE